MNLYSTLIRHDGVKPLFRAIEMSITSLCNDHPFNIHAEGVRGTGKTTVLRAARDILPPIVRIKNCIYNCHPANPHCPLHRHLSPSQVQAIGIETVPRPYLEISQSARPGSIVGSIDLAKLTDQNMAVAALLPGTIPLAHRGVIFIDEINRLADTAPELADILLDVMGTKPGRVQIEEPGLPTVELPVSVSIWAASNPDEEPGPLNQIRRQLSDRFDLAVAVKRPEDKQAIINILANRRNSVSSNPPCQLTTGKPSDIIVTDEIRSLLASIYLDFNLESLRAIEALETAAVLEALLAGDRKVMIVHLAHVLPLALSHRIDAAAMANILSYLQEYGIPRSESEHILPEAAPPRSQINALQRLLTRISCLLTNIRCNSSTQCKTTSSPGQSDTNTSIGGLNSPQSGTQQVAAPPKPALPLTQLADNNLITTEFKQNHD